MTDIVTLARLHKHIAPTHYEGCEADHIGCLVNKLADEIERLRADLDTQQGCCDGAAAQDAHIRQEREEHRAEVDRLRAANKELVAGIDNISRRNREEIERLRADRRERIATAALQGMLASAELVAPPVHAGFIAKWAVVYADALIAKLDEEPQP